MSITSYNSIFSKPFPKTLILEFDDDPQTVISNDKVVQESMELEETLCSDSNLKYGCCESSCFNVRVVNNGSLKGKTFTAKLQFQSRGILINDSGDYIENDEGSYIGTYNSSNVDTITIGNYKVYSDKPTSDRAYRDLMCYDLMYDILDVDVASWYNGLTFPMTLKSIRDSLFTFLGVTQETTTLINDNYTVKGNYQVDSLSCKDVLQSICEVNGVFGHINRSGNFEYISLPSVETVVLDHHINGKGGYEDFVTSAITGVECIPIDSDIGTKVGTDTNLYILDNNLIFYGDEGSQEQVAALTNLLNKIKTFTYRPCSITTYGNPMMEIGTSIVDTVNDLIVESFVMSRYLSGIQAMKDEYRAYGDEKYPENVNSLKTSVKRLAGKTAKIRQELDSFSVDYADYKEQVASQFEQTAENISLSVKGVVERASMIVDCYMVTTSGTTATLMCQGNIDYFSVKLGTVFGIRMSSAFSTTALPLNKELTVNLSTPYGPVGFSGDMYYNSTTRLTNQIKVEENDILYVRITGTAANPTFTVLTEALSHSEITVMKDKIVLKVDSGGKIVAVKLSADPTGSALQIGADNINLSANDVFNIMSGGTLNLTGKSIQISSTNFSVTSAGAVTASNLTISGGSITLGTKFSVTSAGVVTCSDITATGGKIGNYTIDGGALKSTSGNNKVQLFPAYIYLEDASTNINIQPNQIACRGTAIVITGTGSISCPTITASSSFVYGTTELSTYVSSAVSSGVAGKLNSTDGVYKDTVSNTSGQVMHGRALGHTYQCNWTGSQLDFYVDQTGVGTLSDKRLKKDIEDVDNKLIEAINDCPMKQYKAENRGGLISFGIIAQDLVKACEDRDIDILDYEILQKKHYKDGDDTEYYMIDNGQLAILEIQALKEEIKELRRIING